MRLSVQCYNEIGSHGEYKEIEAKDAKEAAERVCGETLTEHGRSRLRAMVHTIPTSSKLAMPFYRN